MGNYKYWLSGLIFILFLVFMLLKEAGNFLVIDEEPVQSDVIVILSGGGIERLVKGADLYEKGYAPYVIISNGAEDNLYAGLKNLGVPDHAIILETKASSTTENALFTKELMEKHQFRSAIVVSSNYHMRRVKSNFIKALANSPIRLIYCSVPSNGYNGEKWWISKENRMATLTEYIKLVGNFFGIHDNEAKNVLNKLLSFK